MSQLSKLVATLKSQSAYELMGDMPLFTAALAEIEQNFIDLEKKIAALTNPSKPPIATKSLVGPDIGSKAPSGVEA